MVLAINSANLIDQAKCINSVISDGIAAKREAAKSIQSDISQLMDMVRLDMMSTDEAKEKITILRKRKEVLEKDIEIGILTLGKQELEIRAIAVMKQSSHETPQSGMSISSKATSSKSIVPQRPQIPDDEPDSEDDVFDEDNAFVGYHHHDHDDDADNHFNVDNEEEKIITLDDIKSIFHPTTDQKFYQAAETLFDQSDTGLTDVSVETKFNDLTVGAIYSCYYRGNDKTQESQEEVTSLLDELFIVVDKRMIGESSRSRSTTSNLIYDIVAYKKPNSMRRDTLESSKVQKKLKFYLQTDKKVDRSNIMDDEEDEDLSLKCLYDLMKREKVSRLSESALVLARQVQRSIEIAFPGTSTPGQFNNWPIFREDAIVDIYKQIIKDDELGCCSTKRIEEYVTSIKHTESPRKCLANAKFGADDEWIEPNNNNRKKKNTNKLPSRQNSPRKAKQQKTA